MPSPFTVRCPASILKEGWEVTVGTEFGCPLHTSTDDTSRFGTPLRGIIRTLIALYTMGENDALTSGWDGSIRVIDECVPFGTLAVTFAVVLHIEGNFRFIRLVRALNGVQLGKSQGKDQE